MEQLTVNNTECNSKRRNIKLFFDNFMEERKEIFEILFNVLEKENRNVREAINTIINEKNTKINDKIKRIKGLKLQKYLENYKSNYTPELLQKYKLDLRHSKYSFGLKLVFKGSIEELERKDNGNKKKDVNITKINKNEHNNNIINKNHKAIPILDINFLEKINIADEEEWICNTEYALYLIHSVKKLKNPHPKSINDSNEPDDSDSSYSLKEDFDIEHLIYISSNKNLKKKIIELEADLNISEIYDEIKKDGEPNYNDNAYIQYSIPDINIKDISEIKGIYNNEVNYFFQKLDSEPKEKMIIFQDESNLNSFYKIVLLNNLYLNNSIRYLYLDLNIIEDIKKTIEKRKYLAFYIARIYNAFSDFKESYELFIKKSLKKIRDNNFINDFIENIIEENDSLIKEKNEILPLFIIIDNINTDIHFKILEKLMDKSFKNKVYIYGALNIESKIGKEKFFSLYNQKHYERGFYLNYLVSSNGENKNLLDDLHQFLNKLGNSIYILKEFIQLIYFKNYINECEYTNNEFLMKYIKYIKLEITEDSNNILNITNVEFKNEEIKNQFILNYKNILLSYLSKNDENIKDLFTNVDGIFFEKQIILDVFLDKIKDEFEQKKNFKELKVNTIYCMKLDFDERIYEEYKGKNIILIHGSRTGEIYDFGIIVGDSIKLYQVSINKPEKNLFKLNKNLIEVDCENMINNNLNKIGKYENFNFGIITSKFTFENYFNLKEQEKNEPLDENKEKITKKIELTPYYLMKKYCENNKYEFLVYDIFEKKLFIEDEYNKLIEYNNFYEFKTENKLNLPRLNNIFSLYPKKLSIKYVNKNNFISLLNKTNIFSNIEDTNSINIIGKFSYDKNFLDIKEIEEDNFCLFISSKNKFEKKSLNIFKYKNETIFNEINGDNSNILPYQDNYEFIKNTMKKKNTEILLFSLEKNIKFIGNKRKRSSS